MGDDDTKKLLDGTKGKSFMALRDEALIRLYYNTGARLSEIGNLLLTDLDMNTESVHLHGKGAKDRRCGSGRRHPGLLRGICGPGRSAKALPRSRSCGRARNRCPERHQADAQASRCRRRGDKYARSPVAAQLRPRMAPAGGNTGDLMLLLGWASEDMPRRYGASAAAERAQELQVQMGIGERV